MLDKDKVAALDDIGLLDAWIAHKPVANDDEQNMLYSLLLESALVDRFGINYRKQVDARQAAGNRGAPKAEGLTSEGTGPDDTTDTVEAEPSAYSSWSGDFAKLGEPDQLRVAELIDKGEAIIGTRAEILQRLGTTKLVAVIKETSTGKLIACGAVKNNGPGYRTRRFEYAGVDLSGYEAADELGYVVVDKDFKGNHLSRTIVEMIIATAAGALFATTDCDRMKKTLSGQGFEQAGSEWPGDRGPLTLWLRPTTR